MVDTGFAVDGIADFTLPPGMIRPALQKHAALATPMVLRFSSDTANPVFLYPSVMLGSETCENIRVAEIEIEGNVIDGFMALPFLARHKVTFDFPNMTMYLKLRHPETGRQSQ